MARVVANISLVSDRTLQLYPRVSSHLATGSLILSAGGGTADRVLVDNMLVDSVLVDSVLVDSILAECDDSILIILKRRF